MLKESVASEARKLDESDSTLWASEPTYLPTPEEIVEKCAEFRRKDIKRKRKLGRQQKKNHHRKLLARRRRAMSKADIRNVEIPTDNELFEITKMLVEAGVSDPDMQECDGTRWMIAE